MKTNRKLAICCYCIVSVVCLFIYGLIATNYDDHLLSNSVLFFIWGILLIGYIPWTIVAGLTSKKHTKQNDFLVVAIAYVIFLLLIFFGELSKYLIYIKVTENYY